MRGIEGVWGRYKEWFRWWIKSEKNAESIFRNSGLCTNLMPVCLLDFRFRCFSCLSCMLTALTLYQTVTLPFAARETSTSTHTQTAACILLDPHLFPYSGGQTDPFLIPVRVVAEVTDTDRQNFPSRIY